MNHPKNEIFVSANEFTSDKAWRRIVQLFAPGAEIDQDCCRQVEAAEDLESLLRSPLLGYRLNLHALQCPECAARVLPYWNRARDRLSPAQLSDFSKLKTIIKSKAAMPSQSYSGNGVSRAVATVRRMVRQGRMDLAAASCTFYVRDPYWTDEFRLLAWPGVKVVETMHGFLGTEGSKAVVVEGDSISFSEDAASDPSRCGMPVDLPDRIPADVRPLFGDFVTREGVASSARLQYREEGSVEAVLFVNYEQKRKINRPLKAGMLRLLARLVDYLPAIRQELLIRDAPTVGQLFSTLKTAEQLATISLNDQNGLQDHFKSILTALMDAVGLTAQNGLATIHLYQQDAQLVYLAACQGDAEHIELARFQHVSEAKGVISWVALRRGPIIIRDLKSSPFKRIHVGLKEGVKSELAAPILYCGQLLGVLNLESTNRATFRRHHLRAITYAANIAAAAVRLFQELATYRQLKSLNRGLLQCFRNAAENADGVELAVDHLARLLGEALNGDCHLWCYDASRTPHFCDAGATYASFDAEKQQPRNAGWSDYICRTKQFIWITDIRSSTEYGVYVWNLKTHMWIDLDLDKSVPHRLHDSIIEHHVASALGIPIFVGERRVGVAWLKYERRSVPPHPEQMSLAIDFVSGAGLIMEWARLHKAAINGRTVEGVAFKKVEELLVRQAAYTCVFRDDPRLTVV